MAGSISSSFKRKKVFSGFRIVSERHSRIHRHRNTRRSGRDTRATPGAPPGLVALLFLSTCRNYEVSDERIHRIAI